MYLRSCFISVVCETEGDEKGVNLDSNRGIPGENYRKSHTHDGFFFETKRLEIILYLLFGDTDFPFCHRKTKDASNILGLLSLKEIGDPLD